VNTLVKPLETVLARRNEDSNLRVSALSLLSMACQTCPVALSSQMSELIDWVLNILEIEKTAEVRRGIYEELSITCYIYLTYKSQLPQF
jgi:hypothetical protein